MVFFDKSAPIISPSTKAIYIDGEKYPLSEQVVANIEKIVGFQAKQSRQLPLHDRATQKIAAFFGKSEFLYLQLLFFLSWIVCTHVAPQLLPFGLPPFDAKEMGIDMSALLIATGVLVQQSRQDKIAEQRSHLTLQINLLTEQKIAKLIELIEELREDLPTIRDREDFEARIMQQATDPQIVLDILQDNLGSTEP